MRDKTHDKKRGRPFALLLSTLLGLIIASSPLSVPAVADWRHDKMINSAEYKIENGFWEVFELPEEFRLNSMHAAVLPTGKVLLIAGSGNNRDNFNAFNDNSRIQVLKTVVLDPVTMKFKNVNTPSDLFCSGHTLLQSGNLLVAGGTSGYELLKGDVKKPAGGVTLHNENPNDNPRTLKKGTKLIGPSGKAYLTMQEVTVPPAEKTDHGNGNVVIHHSSTRVFVEAVEADASYVTKMDEHYKIEGLTGKDRDNVYGQGGPMTLEKQDFRGDDETYEFDPESEEYVRVGNLNTSRWYPSLPVLENGNVVAVSGLDNTGNITETTEVYNPVTKKWSYGPSQALPTYPALFRTADPNVLFYTGSSAGYGPEDKGRMPGYWNVKTNTFTFVEGLRDTKILETSASVALPPKKGSNDGIQNFSVMVAGGGGVGESQLVTDRIDIIDLASKNPRFKPGANLPQALRYLNMTVTPWDEVFANGGSSDYRAKNNSYSKKSFSYDPSSNTYTSLADELVPRSYHSGSLLLPDGRIMVFGNDPLYNDKDNTAPGKYEQRVEIFTPPQLYRGERPVLIGKDSQEVSRGQTVDFTSTNAISIKTARLIPPSSATHVTNIEQRSVAAIVKTDGSKVSVTLPTESHVLTNGWYMLFVTSNNGTPSFAKMVHVVN